MKKLLMLLALFIVNSMAIAAPVNVNSADAKTIADALAGIGQKKAEAIVKYRTEKGPFKTADDLTQVTGITKKILAKNVNDILLSDTATPVPTPAPETKK
jgi:competence protein ComEA